MPGRRRRISGYMSAAKRQTKNIQTRRTRVAIIQRDLRKVGSGNKSRRVG